MRNGNIYTLTLCMVFAYSCNSPAKDNKVKNQPDTIHTNRILKDTVGNKDHVKSISTTSDNSGDSIIQLEFKEKSGILKTTVEKDYQKIHVLIKNVTTKKISASLTAGGKDRNIRFNQIELPDGNTDGPFGLALSYDTKQKGNYTLIIGRNNMAEGDVKGPVSITVNLK